MIGELNWIKEIKSIESLVLDNSQHLENTTLGQIAVGEFEEAFSAGLPMLKKLHIKNDLFDSARVFWWPKYFPNLTELVINNCKVTPSYLISELTKLESLTHLKLIDLPNLKDVAFSAEIPNRFVDPSSSLMKAPAIACFKSLKYLEIMSCSALTDLCIFNGIVSSTTLEKLKVYYCNKIPDNYYHWGKWFHLNWIFVLDSINEPLPASPAPSLL